MYVRRLNMSNHKPVINFFSGRDIKWGTGSKSYHHSINDQVPKSAGVNVNFGGCIWMAKYDFLFPISVLYWFWVPQEHAKVDRIIVLNKNNIAVFLYVLWYRTQLQISNYCGKGKVFPYLLPLSHPHGGRPPLLSARPVFTAVAFTRSQ